MKIIWSPLSVERITEISEYIAEDNPDASVTWVESIFEIIERLKQFPESGRIVPEINKSHIREIIHGKSDHIQDPTRRNIHLNSTSL